jgi:hypothetical protein
MGSHGGNEIALLAKQRRTPLFIKFERCSQGARGAPRRHWGSDGASGPEEQPDCALSGDDYKEQLSDDVVTRNVSTNFAHEAATLCICDPGENRTPDAQLRRLPLYPLSYGVWARKV